MTGFMNGRALDARRELARMAIAEGHLAREALRREQEQAKDVFLTAQARLEYDGLVLGEVTRDLIEQGRMAEAARIRILTEGGGEDPRF